MACIEHCEHETSDLEQQAKEEGGCEGGEGGDSHVTIVSPAAPNLGALTMTGTGIPFTTGAGATGEDGQWSSISGVDGGVDERRSRASSDESLELQESLDLDRRLTTWQSSLSLPSKHDWQFLMKERSSSASEEDNSSRCTDAFTAFKDLFIDTSSGSILSFSYDSKSVLSSFFSFLRFVGFREAHSNGTATQRQLRINKKRQIGSPTGVQLVM